MSKEQKTSGSLFSRVAGAGVDFFGPALAPTTSLAYLLNNFLDHLS